ncbi:MAG: RNA polymerase sigma factor [Planctomycetota bacterium]|jgi:RNA polymerase sigma-70 factor (ECF subfamily)
MIEDTLLVLKFKHGSSSALCRIYEKYRVYLLRLATALLHDVNVAEDVVHDVFLGFARSGDKIKLSGSLRAYLRTCVVNGARNEIRAMRVRSSVKVDEIHPVTGESNKPDHWIVCNEQSSRISNALFQIPDEQREVVVLHLLGDMKFREIAKLQTVSLKTAQSRYRYGLEKLRLQLNGELDK